MSTDTTSADVRNEQPEKGGTLRQKTFRVAITHQSVVESFVSKVAALKNELFMLCNPKHEEAQIRIYDVNKLAEVKAVIPLSNMFPLDLIASHKSNCLFILDESSYCRSVKRVIRDRHGFYSIMPWIGELSLSYAEVKMFSTINGNLFLISHKNTPNAFIMSIYDSHGFAQREIELDPVSLHFVGVLGVVCASNEKVIIATYCYNHGLNAELREIDYSGKLLREYRSSVFGDGGFVSADNHGRIAVLGNDIETELVDKDFRFVVKLPRQKDGFHVPCSVQYNIDRREIVRLVEIKHEKFLMMFHYIQE